MRRLPLILALALTACGPAANPATPTGGASRPPVARPSAGAPVVAPPATSAPPAPDVVAPILSNNGATLLGKVSAPAGLVSNNGGSLISDKGGAYRLRAIAQVPVAGARVRVLDAAGNVALAPDGTPLVTTTDAAGGYAFAAVLPARNLVVEVTAGDAVLRAIAPPASGRREVDVELVSTLTTTYILERFVRPQAVDPLVVLERLPADVEAATRARAEAAIGSGGVAVSSLAQASVLAAVDALRKADGAFDSQLAAVERLMVIAGAADAGSGLKATEVLLGAITQALRAPDGSYYLNAGDVWRVRTDGVIERIAADGAWEGPVAIDAAGRVWRGGSYPDYAIRRRSADGKLMRVGEGMPPAYRFVPTTGDGCIAVCKPTPASPTEIWEVPPDGGPARKALTLSGEASDYVGGAGAMARDAAGKLYFNGYALVPAISRLDPATGAFTIVQDGGKGPLLLDAAANWHYQDERGVHVVAPDGTERLFPGAPAIPAFRYEGVAPTPEGAYCYLSFSPLTFAAAGRSLYRLDGTTPVLVAGKPAQAIAAGSDPTQLTFNYPHDLTALADGRIALIDDGTLLGVGPDGASPLVARDALPKTPEGLQLSPDELHAVPGGSDLFFGASPLGFFGSDFARPLYRLPAGGAPEPVFTPEHRVAAFAAGPDGSLYVAEAWNVGLGTFYGRLKRRAPDGVVTTLIPESDKFFVFQGLRVEPDGSLVMAAQRLEGATGVAAAKFWRWTAETGAQPLPASYFWASAVDAKGRRVASIGDYIGATGRLDRFDPASGKTEVLVGPGGRFGQDGTDFGWPTFDGQGNLLFVDVRAKQVKRIPAGSL